MKTLLKKTSEMLGGRIYSRDSLPTGVNWLHDIRRAGALGAQPVCFDVGANVGQTVAELRRAFASARIHAFEPFATPRAVLTAATMGDSLVTVSPLAMGALAARVNARPHRESLMSSIVPGREDPQGLPAEPIDVDTLDGYCECHGIEAIDILKSDTEGYDLEVLRCASALLAGQCVGYLYIEVTFMPHDRQHTAFAPVFELLSNHGYRFLGLYETFPLHHFEETSVYCNALFVAARVRERALALRRTAA